MIGVFDSGVGGLTVARAVRDRLSGHDMIYFGDTARTPYGTKSPATVVRYALGVAHFLKEAGAKVIVIACNTASAVAHEAIKAEFDLPVFEVITPAAELAAKSTRNRYVGVIGTRATVESNVYPRAIRACDESIRVFQAACPLLVPLVEEGWTRRPETRMIVKKYLHPLKTRRIDTLILGCTHYPLLLEAIRGKAGKRVTVVDGAAAVAGRIAAFFDENPKDFMPGPGQGETRFFVTDRTPHFEKVARSAFHRNVSLALTEIP